jgi:hypothetical protein
MKAITTTTTGVIIVTASTEVECERLRNVRIVIVVFWQQITKIICYATYAERRRSSVPANASSMLADASSLVLVDA